MINYMIPFVVFFALWIVFFFGLGKLHRRYPDFVLARKLYSRSPVRPEQPSASGVNEDGSDDVSISRDDMKTPDDDEVVGWDDDAKTYHNPHSPSRTHARRPYLSDD